jgi:hypothetical protein
VRSRGTRVTVAPSLNRLHLVVQTSDRPTSAATTGNLILKSGFNPVKDFGSPPPARGLVKHFEHTAAPTIDRDAFVLTPAFLALSSLDTWTPRWAFLFGEDTATTARVPLAYDFGTSPLFPTTAANNYPLQMITPGNTTDRRDLLVVWIATATPDTLHTAPESSGPLELAIYSVAGQTLYQTTLSRIGQQDPATRGGHYLAILQVQPGLGLDATNSKLAVITNKSDDAWWPARVEIFALSGVGRTGRHLGGVAGSAPYVSQDPNDITEVGGVKPGMALTIPLAVGI